MKCNLRTTVWAVTARRALRRVPGPIELRTSLRCLRPAAPSRSQAEDSRPRAPDFSGLPSSVNSAPIHFSRVLESVQDTSERWCRATSLQIIKRPEAARDMRPNALGRWANQLEARTTIGNQPRSRHTHKRSPGHKRDRQENHKPNNGLRRGRGQPQLLESNPNQRWLRKRHDDGQCQALQSSNRS